MLCLNTGYPDTGAGCVSLEHTMEWFSRPELGLSHNAFHKLRGVNRRGVECGDEPRPGGNPCEAGVRLLGRDLSAEEGLRGTGGSPRDEEALFSHLPTVTFSALQAR